MVGRRDRARPPGEPPPETIAGPTRLDHAARRHDKQALTGQTKTDLKKCSPPVLQDRGELEAF